MMSEFFRVFSRRVSTRLALTVFVGGLMVGVGSTGQAVGQNAVQITPVAGDSYSATLESIDSDGVLHGSGFPEGTILDAARIIRFATSGKVPEAAQAVVFLQGGSRIMATSASLADEILTIEHHGRRAELPIELARGVCFDAEQKMPEFADGLDRPLPEFDRLFVWFDDKLQSVTAVVETIEARQVNFLFDDQQKTIERERVYGIVVADFGLEFPDRFSATVSLFDGSQIFGDIRGLNEGVLTLHVAGRLDVVVPADAISEIRIKSDRLAFLSEETPVKVESKPLVTLPKEWQRDLSVDGNPLTLFIGEGVETRRYERGIGTHSYSYIEFENDRDFDRFSATIGIDAETNGRGDCVFIVQGDGRQLFSRRMRGSDEPFEVDLDIDGVSRLALIVEPGEDLDLGDHANWCDARMLRTTR